MNDGKEGCKGQKRLGQEHLVGGGSITIISRQQPFLLFVRWRLPFDDTLEKYLETDSTLCVCALFSWFYLGFQQRTVEFQMPIEFWRTQLSSIFLLSFLNHMINFRKGYVSISWKTDEVIRNHIAFHILNLLLRNSTDITYLKGKTVVLFILSGQQCQNEPLWTSNRRR